VNTPSHGGGDMAEESKPDMPRQEKDQASRLAAWENRTNMLAVVLMAAATLGSSWSAYQSSLWNGVQIFRLTDAAAFSRAANEKRLTANQLRTVEASLFVEFARDMYEGKKDLSSFLLKRMRPELRDAIQAWLATQPMTNPRAPSTPFEMPQYKSKMDGEARELDTRSEAFYAEAQTANRTSDTYTMISVIYTSALFLSGLVSGFDHKLTRRLLLALSLIMLLMALFIMVRQPITHPG